MGRVAAALAAALLAPWAFRALSLSALEEGAVLGDARGFAADAGVALIVLGVCWLVARASRWLALALLLLLSIGYYANTETIAALGTVASPLDLAFLTDPTFVGGSGVAIGHPWILAAVLVGVAVLGHFGLARRAAGDALLAIAAGGLVIGALSLPEPSRELTTWRQVNAVAHNAEWIARRDSAERGAGYASSARAIFEADPSQVADLDAPLAFTVDGRRKNVLLVILESVSGSYLPTATAAHGREPVNRMPNLDGAFARNIGYATFFTHNRRTNRGLYSLLCGEMPRLTAGMPKMTVAATRPWQRCLPEILRDEGYRTVYLQSAPLAFMLKDRFMPVAGFDETLGHDWFEDGYLRTLWGVDDMTFFEQAVRKIEELRGSGEPWFLTLLTVGSHHPFVIPESFEAPFQTKFRRAFAYLDVSVGKFLRAIERSGLRDDTLVIFTTDESAGDVGKVADRTAGVLSQNWGYAVWMTPERTQGLVTEPFAQSDMALSVVDYLGLGDEAEGLAGRSLLRRYERGRRIYYGNVNHRILGGLKPDGSIVQCELEGARCARYTPPQPGAVFGPVLERAKAAPGFEERIREIARRSRPPADDAPLTIPLITNPVFEVTSRDKQIVQGMSQLALRPGEWFEVELEAEARGEGRVELMHAYELSSRNKVLRSTTRIDAGQRLRLRYVFSSDLPVSQSRVKTSAKLLEGDSVELVFHRRRFVLRRSGEVPEQGAQVKEYALEPATDDPAARDLQLRDMQEFEGFLRVRMERGMPEDAEAGDGFE